MTTVTSPAGTAGTGTTGSPARSRRAFLAVAVSVASLASLQNLVIPLIPLIRDDLGVSSEAAAWTLTAWLIAAAVATPLLGRVGDLRGRRTVFLAVLAVVAIGDLVAFASPDLGTLLVARVLQGAGGALFPLAFGIIRDAVPIERVPGSIGALSAVIGIGGAAGSVAAGPLSTLLGWRGLFLVPLAISIIGGVATFLAVPRTGTRASGRVNIPAAVLLSGWLVALLLPLSSGARWGWTSPGVIALFAAAAVLLAAWVVVELGSREPLVDIRLMLDRRIWPANLASLLVGAAVFGYWGYLPQFLQTPTASGWGLGATVAQSGFALLPMLVAMSAAGFLTGRIGRVLGLRTQLALGSAAMAVAIAATALLHTSVVEVAAIGLLFGAGVGLAYAATASIVVQSAPADQTGIASGVNANLRTIGSAIGSSAVSAIVFGSAGADGLPKEGAYDTAFAVLVVLTIATAVLMAVARDRRRRHPETSPVQVEEAGRESVAEVA